MRFSDRFPYVSRHLTIEGVAGGDHDANVDGSATPVLFKVSPPAAGVIAIGHLSLTVRDSGAFRAERYGALATLASGVVVGLFKDSDGSLVQSFTNSHAVQANAQWAHYCNETQLNTWGSGDSFLTAHWEFLSDSGVSILLVAGSDLAFGVQINDDLTGLVEHEFLVQGFSSAKGV
jgi:hypothetical protein